MSDVNSIPGPKDPKEKDSEKEIKKEGGDQNSVLPDMTPRREGGDDAIAEAHPEDPRLDEKVIVNEQIENKAVNAPSQTGAGLNGTEDSPL